MWKKLSAPNLAKATGTTITASNVRGNDVDFKPGNVVDGDDATYWTTDDGTKSGSLTIKWNTAKKFDVVSIEEAIQKGQHINSYTVEYKTSDSANWQTLKTRCYDRSKETDQNLSCTAIPGKNHCRNI